MTNNWTDSIEGSMPDTQRTVRIRGTMTALAQWDVEANMWRMIEDAQIQCNVLQWQEMPSFEMKGYENLPVEEVGEGQIETNPA